MRMLLNAIIALLCVNMCVLLWTYTLGHNGDEREAAQSFGKLISAYAEPNSNPQFLVRAEDQCRFWDTSYCARALAKRKAAQLVNPFNPPIPDSIRSTPLYAAYAETRKALTGATNEYIAFLNQNPGKEEYVERSKEFEEQAGVLIGQLVSYLYDMQSQTITRQTRYSELAVMAQYLIILLLLLLAAFLRFRRGGLFND